MQKIADALSPVYRRFLPAFFESEIPREAAATCDDCAMVAPPEAAAGGHGHYFLAACKCCTHLPNLPNYLVGALLSSTEANHAEGRRRIRRRIEARADVSPAGVLRPLKYYLLIRNTEQRAFGTSRWLVCPYYDAEAGRCTIWPFWNATCNTWFCKYNAGQDGRAFWTGLRDFLRAAEELLLTYALHEIGCDPRKIGFSRHPRRSLTVAELDDRPPGEEAYRRAWGDWAGREEELYKQTHRIVSDLTAERFERIMGISQTVLLADIAARRREMVSPSLPETLKRNPQLGVEKRGDGSYMLIGYSGCDPLEVSRRIYDLLDCFDGRRSNDQVVSDLLAEGQAVPTEELLLSLHQFRVLVDAEPQEAAGDDPSAPSA